MGKACIEQQQTAIAISGELTIDNVPGLVKKGVALLDETFKRSEKAIVDLSKATSTASASLLLLVELYRHSNAAGKAISFSNTPDALVKIAKVCGLSDILPFA